MTANPAIVTTTSGAWKKVATNVTSCRVFASVDSTARYLITFRLTGGAAPHVTTALPEALTVPVDGVLVQTDDAVDVYVYSYGAGSVLVHA
jgi:hypothetical protein